jgi:hypothetical protein
MLFAHVRTGQVVCENQLDFERLIMSRIYQNTSKLCEKLPKMTWVAHPLLSVPYIFIFWTRAILGYIFIYMFFQNIMDQCC